MLSPVSPMSHEVQTSFRVDISPLVSRCVNISVGLTSFFLRALGLYSPCFLSPGSPHIDCYYSQPLKPSFFLSSVSSIISLYAQTDAILFFFLSNCPPSKWLMRAPESRPLGKAAVVMKAELLTFQDSLSQGELPGETLLSFLPLPSAPHQLLVK